MNGFDNPGEIPHLPMLVSEALNPHPTPFSQIKKLIHLIWNIASKTSKRKKPDMVCCIFRPTFGCRARLSKFSFKAFFVLKSWKMQKSNKFVAKFSKKKGILSLHQNAGQRFYTQNKELFLFSLIKNRFSITIWHALGTRFKSPSGHIVMIEKWQIKSNHRPNWGWNDRTPTYEQDFQLFVAKVQ